MFFELNHSYYLYILFKKNVNLHSKFKIVNKVETNLDS